jgi:hypothetical protein
MGIKNYLTKRKETFVNNYRKNQEREKEIKRSEEIAYQTAQKEARIKKAIDRAYNEQGYHRDNKGNLQPNNRRNNTNNRRNKPRNPLTTIANNITNTGNQLFDPTTNKTNRTPTQKRHTKRKQKRNNWSTWTI